eukprot:g443.t1
MESRQVRPVETDTFEERQDDEKKEKETINLFEVLEDRYAYEGFNKFVFYCFLFFAVYQWMLSSFRNVDDIAGHVNLIRNKLVPSSKDLFEREEFNAWGLKKMKDMIDNPKFFGDKYNLLRVTAYIEPTLCNSTNHHPHGSLDAAYYDANGIHKSSFMKSYEEAYGCPIYSSKQTREGKHEIMSLLQSKYDVYSVYHEWWRQISIPMYSAELHSQNSSNAVKKQRDGLKTALAIESRALRLESMYIEVLNPYDNIVLVVEIMEKDITTKKFQYYTRSLDTIPRSYNIMFITWTIIVGLCVIWMFVDAIQVLNKSRGTLLKTIISNGFEIFVEVLLLPIALFLIHHNNFFTKAHLEYMKSPIGTIQKLEQTTKFAEIYEHKTALMLIYANSMNKYCSGFTLLLITPLLVKHVSWHPGTSVLTTTLSNAFGDILDTAVVVLILLIGFGASGYIFFGTAGGSYDFISFSSGFNTMARLSFGLLDYDAYMSDGYGHGYEGLGLGGGSFLKIVLLWMSFILLSTVIVNILIAVISDGFEIHKDNQRLRTKSGQTLIAYAIHRMVYLIFFQSFSCCKKYQPSWINKMHFTSSKHAQTLLNCCDALPDGMVFDQKLQTKVLRSIIGQGDDNNITGKRAMRIVRTKSYSIKKITKSDVMLSDEIISFETTQEFFSHLKSKKSLLQVIETIFEVQAETTKKQSKVIENFRQSKDDVCSKIWNLYKNTNEERERKKESRVEGNHVRKVVKPIEERMKIMEQKIDKIEDNMNEIKDLLLKIANK